MSVRTTLEILRGIEARLASARTLAMPEKSVRIRRIVRRMRHTVYEARAVLDPRLPAIEPAAPSDHWVEAVEQELTSLQNQSEPMVVRAYLLLRDELRTLHEVLR